jgi:hypothetical protein
MSDGFSEEDRKEIARLTALIEQPLKTALGLRAICKWLLELLRNCIVVAGLFILANKSNSWLMLGVAVLGGFALAIYCSTYVDEWKANTLFGGTTTRRTWRVFVIFMCFELMTLAITVSLYLAINKIVEVQGH